MEAILRKVRIALTPRSWLLSRRLSNGVVVFGANKAGFGGRGIYLEGDGIEPELEHLEALLEPDDVFVDVGANTGMFALKAARRVGPQGIVLAVDPSIEMMRILAYSVRANALTNVRLRNLCLGPTTGAMTLWMNDDKPVRFSLLPQVSQAPKTSVLAVKLDDLCRWEALERLDYLKIDVVGAEEQVLAGATETLQRFHPIVQVAITNRDAPISLPGYDVYRLGGSENKVYVPDGDPRVQRFTRLGWQKTKA